MSKFAIQIAMADVPHLDEAARKAIEASYMPHEKGARVLGIPSLGAGAIYPIAESDVLCDPFEFPLWYKHCYALDVGWNRTACIWGAVDPETDVCYLYSEHYRGAAEPPIHAEAIKSRGTWIPGVVDPAARGRGQKDGEQLLVIYQGLGLNLTVANNAVESGIYKVWTRLSTGKLKVFRTMQNWLAEFRIYRRDEKGKIVKENDHEMDACFHGDTLVHTDSGLKPIASLVGTSGWVLSFQGYWDFYVACHKTRQNAKLVRLTFDDGSTIDCTPDHRFWTEHGWRKAVDMAHTNCHIVVPRGVHSTCYDQLSLPEHVKSLTVGATTFLESISLATEFVCTARSGASILAPSPKANVSIISITIDGITNPKTLSLWLGERIQAIIKKAIHDLSLNMLWKKLLSGTVLMKAQLGISSIMSSSSTSCMREPLASARTVGKRLRERSSVHASAQTLARQDIVSNRVSMTWIGRVANAVRTFASIAMSKRKSVAKHAYLKCLHVVILESRADVYCLRVPNTEAFAVGPGIVAHNCRYLCASGIELAVQKPAGLWGAGHRPFAGLPTLAGRSQHQINYDPMASLWQPQSQTMQSPNTPREPWMPHKL